MPCQHFRDPFETVSTNSTIPENETIQRSAGPSEIIRQTYGQTMQRDYISEFIQCIHIKCARMTEDNVMTMHTSCSLPNEIIPAETTFMTLTISHYFMNVEHLQSAAEPQSKQAVILSSSYGLHPPRPFSTCITITQPQS